MTLSLLVCKSILTVRSLGSVSASSKSASTFSFKSTVKIMENELKSVLSITPAEYQDSVEAFYKKNGMVETVIHLTDKVWDENIRKQADEAIQKRDTSSKYFEVLFQHFNIQEHFNQVDSHRHFIKKAYERLRQFVPNMTAHEAEVHDLSKYTFAQSVGYTARWVHMLDNECWKNSLQDHYCNEPHHPQFYEIHGEKKNGEEKPRMERKYLEESLIDMVASRWERQLKGDENVSNHSLVDFNPVYLSRYQKDDKAEVFALIETIQKSQREGNLNDCVKI